MPVPIDPAAFDSRAWDPVPWLGDVNPEAQAAARAQVDTLAARVPDRLGYVLAPLILSLHGWTQSRIAAATGVSQPAVCTRCQTARVALAVAAQVTISPREAERWLLDSGEDPKVASTVSAFLSTWHHTDAARMVGASQQWVGRALDGVEARHTGTPVAVALGAIRYRHWLRLRSPERR